TQDVARCDDNFCNCSRVALTGNRRRRNSASFISSRKIEPDQRQCCQDECHPQTEKKHRVLLNPLCEIHTVVPPLAAAPTTVCLKSARASHISPSFYEAERPIES